MLVTINVPVFSTLVVSNGFDDFTHFRESLGSPGYLSAAFISPLPQTGFQMKFNAYLP